MDDETAIKLLREVVDVGPLPTDEPETHPLMEAALAAFLELKRYREREPIEHELREAANAVLYQWSCKALSEPAIKRLSKAVAESFKASLAAAAAGDESA